MKATNCPLFIAVLLTFLLSSSLFSMNVNGNSEVEIPQKSIENLIAGIKSANPGLSRSCIYFVGKYKIEEAVNALIEKVRTEEEPNTRILIAITLYQIGDKHGIFELDKMGYNDPDLYVREICKNIYSEYLANEYGANI